MRTTRRLVTVVAAATIATSLAACGGGDSGGGGSSSSGGQNEASDTGVTADSIKLGATFPLTGAAAPGYSEIPTGHQAYYDYVNKNGGVNGRKIQFIYKDDGYNPTNTSSVTNDLVLKEQVFAMVSALGTPTHSAVVDFLNQEGVPDLFVSSGSVTWGDGKKYPQTFGWQTDYEIEAKVIGQYVKQNFAGKKVGLFLQGDDLGRDGAAGVKRYIDQSQIVSEQTYTPGNTDVGPQIAALKAAGAEVVIGFNVPAYTALSQLVSLQLGYKPQWIYSNIASDAKLVGSLLQNFSKGAVTGAGPLEGIITTRYLPTVDRADDPWVQTFKKIWDESGQQGEFTNYRLYGMAQAYTMVMALQAAGQNPTRKSIVEAVQKDGKNWEGPWFAPFRYTDQASSNSHSGIGGMTVAQVAGGSYKDLTGVLTTTNGSADIKEAQAQVSKPPANGIPNVKPVG